jgi:hypothetical protein
MPRCPNCFRETMRTKDWACYLCGYPLASPVFKSIDKTYGQVREERLYGKKPAVVEEQVDIDYEQEKEIPQEMKDVPVVTYTDRETTDSTYEETPVITEEPIEEELSAHEAIEQEEVCETGALGEEENKPVEAVEVYEEVHEEIAISANIDEPEKISDITELNENIEAMKETVENIETESTNEEVPCEIPTRENPEPALSEEPVQVETEPEAAADIYITIDELLAEYAADYLSATAKYVNRILRLSGYAAVIDVKEVLAINYIRLTDASLNLTKSVQCMFDKKYADVLKGLQKGQQVTIQGKYTGSLIAMRMTDCIVVNS